MMMVCMGEIGSQAFGNRNGNRDMMKNGMETETETGDEKWRTGAKPNKIGGDDDAEMGNPSRAGSSKWSCRAVVTRRQAVGLGLGRGSGIGKG